MDEQHAILAELEEMRERAAAFLRARLEAVSEELKEVAARTAAELDVVLPPDLEVLFPLGSMPDRLAGLTRPVLAATPSRECLRLLDRGRAQSEVLQELLRQLDPWCGARAIVIFREGNAVGWSGVGLGEGDPVRSWRGALGDTVALRRVAEGTPVILRPGDDKVLCEWFGDVDRRLLAVPMSLRGKIVGALLALEGEQPLVAETVQLLAYLVGLLLETIAVRPTIPTPALLEPVELAAPAPEVEVIEPVQEEVLEVPEEIPAPVAPPPVVEELPEVTDAGETVHLRMPVTPAVFVPPPVAAAPPRAPEEERKHEEARRFARLLVSEIRLYNEQAVQEGRAAHDIYQRLKEDIDRSREMYEQRVPAEVRAQSNYFFEELVRILADGEPDALGL
ncbi:MAG: hypothetical protein V1750_01510 [Acidobacteriota bacterium]